MDSNSIESPESDYLYVKKSQLSNSGNGLFTAIDIYKDEIIAVFYGETLTNNESDLRAKNRQDSYFMNLINGKILDCINTDGFAKYANDANGFFKSSFKNKAKITLDEDNNVCLVAIHKIKSGEEIFCSYGIKYWNKFSKSVP